ncbi:hypothetical protein FJU30_04650 [Affinibrenneria salicis]|uniref:Uncharacterized protein n=1 Tax=Affinibrenneria salicis TaxID=2590031 RepID=A0A5J5G735_9GAMM|nr:hypothetical protein [Affinibrenneria salicis]KAA9002455.1 hypothetical protein FJU30_00115 [Affinibrenneria salicis]KAA9003257.1 hypothetical protein FJU30_04650 [Affinibrenneria salicis]
MIDIIEYIDKKKKDLSRNGASLQELQKLDFLKKITVFISTHQFDNNIDSIIQIADENTGYSEYRIMNDYESDNKNLWVEYDNGNITLTPGDILIKLQ